MTLEDVPAPYIRKNNWACADKVSKDDGETPHSRLARSAYGRSSKPGKDSFWAKRCLGGNWTEGSTTKELYCAKSCLGVFPGEFTEMVMKLCGQETTAKMLEQHASMLGL
jgi:hypothetical protein